MTVQSLLTQAMEAGIQVVLKDGRLTLVGNEATAHHYACPTCICAGRGYGLRCGAGAALWAVYAATCQTATVPTREPMKPQFSPPPPHQKEKPK